MSVQNSLRHWGSVLLVTFVFNYSRKKISTGLFRQLISWSRVHTAKLAVPQLVKNFRLLGDLKVHYSINNSLQFVTCWSRPIQSTPSSPISGRDNLILFMNLRPGFSSGLFPYVSSPKPCNKLYICHMSRSSHSSCSDNTNNICSFLQSPVTTSLLSRSYINL
jgi:hypothetical protein